MGRHGHVVGSALARTVIGFMVAFGGATALAAAPPPTFQGLGPNTFAYDVSNDAAVVAGRVNGHGAVWRPATGWTSLTPSDGFGYKSSRDGSSVAGFFGASSSTIGGNQAFRWTNAGGAQGLGGLPGGGSNSVGLGISGDGNVVVGSAISTTSAREAFRWSQATGMLSLGAALGTPYQSESHGASFDGSVIVGDLQQFSFGGNKTFRWNNGVVTYLDGSTGGLAMTSTWSVSGDGGTVVGIGPGNKAARWTQGSGGQLLGGITPTDGSGEARDVTADGSVITGFSYVMDNPAGTQTAFVWDVAHGTRDLKQVLQSQFGLNLAGWTLHWAYISDDGGSMAGYGTNPSNQGEAWLATGVPEPAIAALLTPLALAFARRRHARRKTGHRGDYIL